MMASIIPGFEYDIFISYRHNDNRSGWVTDFVNALQEELAATIKEPLSIYFDKNPHDGLLETHNVDKSLEGKLKCLIFIPIISQTYCDAKSFAWGHEFCAFNKLSKEDQFGRDIKLSNGNVASRILPIKIHDLDYEDKAAIEKEIGGVLRAVEFIYKELGVNRPLKISDNKTDNQNKTDYLNQINKVANAVKEIINTLKRPGLLPSPMKTLQSPSLTQRLKKRLALLCTVVLGLLVAGIYFYSQSTEENNIDKSIAVLAFADMSPTHDQEFLGDGISEEIINVLAQTEGLKVIARSSAFQFKGKNEDLRVIGNTLGVATVLEGSVVRVDDRIKVTAQLIRTTDGSHIWSKRFDQDASDIFLVYDDIARGVAEALKTTLQVEEVTMQRTPWNADSYRLFQQGEYFHNRGMKGDGEKAKELFMESIKLDSSHAIVWAEIAHYFMNSSDKERLHYIDKAISLDSTLSEAILRRALFYLQHCEFKKANQDFKRIIRSKPVTPRALRNTGEICSQLGYYNQAVQYAEKAILTDPLQPHSYRTLGQVYLSVGDYSKATAAFKEVSKFAGSESWKDNAFIAFVLNGDSLEAKKLLPHFREEHGKDSLYFAFIFAQCTGRQSKANDYLERWLNSKPSNNFELARAYAFKRDKALMLKFLEKSGEKKEPNLFYLLSDPEFIPYRYEPEFMALKKKLNYP